MYHSNPRNTADDTESPSTKIPTDVDANQSAYPDDDYWKKEYADDPGKQSGSGDSTSPTADTTRTPG